MVTHVRSAKSPVIELRISSVALPAADMHTHTRDG